jgi:hypothetical protein
VSGVPHGLRPFVEVRDELGADRLKDELVAGRWVGYWYDAERDEHHEITQAHWRDNYWGRSSMSFGTFSDHRDLKWTWLAVPRPIFVAPRAAAEGGNAPKIGRPRKHNWEGACIEAGRWIYDNGLPQTQAQLEHHLQKWFGEHCPSEGDIRERAAAVLKAYGWRAGK